MSVHIALLGRSPWALVNTYYASVMKGERPGKVYIVTERGYSGELPKVVGAIKTISEAYGFSPEVRTIVVSDGDFKEAEVTLKGLFSGLKEKGEEVVLNITSGRKALVVAAIVQGRELNMRGVIYLALLDDRFPNRPYMMLPKHLQVLNNFLGEEER